MSEYAALPLNDNSFSNRDYIKQKDSKKQISVKRPIISSAPYDDSPISASLPQTQSPVEENKLIIPNMNLTPIVPPSTRSIPKNIPKSPTSPVTPGYDDFLHQSNVSGAALQQTLYSTEISYFSEKTGIFTVLIDMRGNNDFEFLHIRNSLNVNVMPLIINRLKKNNLGDFQLEKFCSTKSKVVLSELRDSVKKIILQGKLKGIHIIIYDDDMHVQGEGTDVWAIQEIFKKGLCKNFLCSEEEEKKVKIEPFLLTGGFQSFSNQPAIEQFLTTFQPYDQEEQLDSAKIKDKLNNMRLNSSCSSQFPESTSGSSSLSNSMSNSAPISRENSLKVSLNHGRLSSLSINSTQPNSPNSSSGTSSPKIKKPSFSINTETPTRTKRRGLSIFTAGSTVGGAPPTFNSRRQSTAGAQSAIREKLDSSFRSVASPTNEEEGEEKCDELVDSPSTPPMSAVCSPYTLIRPYLYLGSDALPSSLTGVAELNELKVTHILNVAADVVSSPALEENFVVLWLKLKDNLEQEIYEDLKTACQFIDDARKKSEDSVIFVHCKAGKSRSATAVVAYLIWCESMSQNEAYDHVKQLRPEVSPNLGFVMALSKLESEKKGGKALSFENLSNVTPKLKHL